MSIYSSRRKVRVYVKLLVEAGGQGLCQFTPRGLRSGSMLIYSSRA
jgi:hypothetical protein